MYIVTSPPIIPVSALPPATASGLTWQARGMELQQRATKIRGPHTFRARPVPATRAEREASRSHRAAIVAIAGHALGAVAGEGRRS